MKLNTENNKSAVRAIKSGIRRWLREDRKIEYSKRDVCSVYLKVPHSELLFRLSNEDFVKLGSKVKYDVNIFMHKNFLRQKRKFSNLDNYNTSSYRNNNNNNNNTFSNHNFYQRFLNLSNVDFSEEWQLIEKSFKFNIRPFNNKKDLEILGVDCEIVYVMLCYEIF